MKKKKIGEAGFEQPQDCKVTVELTDTGGVNIILRSKMEKMFGNAIRKSAEEELKLAGIENANIEIYDYSSLDFVIRARVKTAAARARSQKK